MPTSEEVYESEKNAEKIWNLLKIIFDLLAMHDVSLLMPKIVKWINKCLTFYQKQSFGQADSSPQRRLLQIGSKAEDLYQDFKSGVVLAQIVYMFVSDKQYQPDFKMMFEFPQNWQEYLHNLSYITHIAIKNNVPIYLKPQEYLEFYQPSFLLLQMYYMYCKFKDSEALFEAGSPPSIAFKDEGRVIADSQSSIHKNSSE